MFNFYKSMIKPLDDPGFKPYLLTALIDWIEACGLTTYMLVDVDDATRVPREFVSRDNLIALCVSSSATDRFKIDEDAVSFRARFNENDIYEIYIPVGRVVAVYPKENTSMMSRFIPVPTPRPADSGNPPGDDDIPSFTKV